MPFGSYSSFEECVAKNRDKEDPAAYCGFIKHQVEGSALYTARVEPLVRGAKHFVKVFAIDADVINGNDWGVTKESVLKALGSLHGLPLLGPPAAGHGPDTQDPNVLKRFETAHTVGRFTEVGLNGYAWGVAEVTDPEAWTKIAAGEWKWVSPLIFAKKMRNEAGNEVVTDWRYSHIAFVDRPAYGALASTKGVCEASDVKECSFRAALRDIPPWDHGAN